VLTCFPIWPPLWVYLCVSGRGSDSPSGSQRRLRSDSSLAWIALLWRWPALYCKISLPWVLPTLTWETSFLLWLLPSRYCYCALPLPWRARPRTRSYKGVQDIIICIFIPLQCRYVTAFAMGAGPIPGLLLPEMYPTQIRAKGFAVCLSVYWVSTSHFSTVLPVLTV